MPADPGVVSPETGATTQPRTIVHVCVTCRLADATAPDGFQRPGPGFLAALTDALADEAGIILRPVKCLSVCRRSIGVALAGSNDQGAEKWGYVLAGLAADRDIDDLARSIRLYHACPDGVVPWGDRPVCFKSGVAARIPPHRDFDEAAS